jgi:hypothetical protein
MVPAATVQSNAVEKKFQNELAGLPFSSESHEPFSLGFLTSGFPLPTSDFQ